MGSRAVSIEERFWPKVDRHGPDKCWEWRASVTRHGYGKIGVAGRGHGFHVGAHRVSYEIHFGAIPEGLHVLHRCDNPPCVNPDHLFLGTHQDNVNDMRAKGRGKCFRRLDEASVREIKRLVPTHTHRQIADLFDISTSAVQHIKRGHVWAHVA